MSLWYNDSPCDLGELLMPELTPEAKLEISEYLDKKERRLIVIGTSSFLSIVALLGGFFYFVMETAISSAKVQAITTINPEIRELRDRIEAAEDEFHNMKQLINSAYGNVIAEQDHTRDTVERAERALEGLNKAQGSLVFGKEILEVKAQLLQLENQLSSQSNNSSNHKTSSNSGDVQSTTSPLGTDNPTLDGSQTIEEAFRNE